MVKLCVISIAVFLMTITSWSVQTDHTSAVQRKVSLDSIDFKESEHFKSATRLLESGKYTLLLKQIRKCYHGKVNKRILADLYTYESVRSSCEQLSLSALRGVGDQIEDFIKNNQFDSLRTAIQNWKGFRLPLPSDLKGDFFLPCTLSFVDDRLLGKSFRLNHLTDSTGYDYVSSGAIGPTIMSFSMDNTLSRPSSVVEDSPYQVPYLPWEKIRGIKIKFSDGCNSSKGVVSVPTIGRLHFSHVIGTAVYCTKINSVENVLYKKACRLLGSVVRRGDYELGDEGLIFRTEGGVATYRLAD